MLAQTIQAGRSAGPNRAITIEAEISHMKTDGRLSRSPLKGTFGDAVVAVLRACGYYIRKILAQLRASFAWIITAILTAINVTRQYLQMLRAA
jgi:IS5 family transposase